MSCACVSCAENASGNGPAHNFLALRDKSKECSVGGREVFWNRAVGRLDSARPGIERPVSSIGCCQLRWRPLGQGWGGVKGVYHW